MSLGCAGIIETQLMHFQTISELSIRSTSLTAFLAYNFEKRNTSRTLRRMPANVTLAEEPPRIYRGNN